MQCKIEGCDKAAKYKKDQVCQTHYHRMWRYGTYDTTTTNAESRITPNGYKKVFDRDHKLADKDGYVFEHRKVLYEKIGDEPQECDLCGCAWSWRPYKDHVDHIDENKLNNDISNLRPLCNSCNTRRNLKPQCEYKGRSKLSFMGKTMTAAEWARQPGIKVSRGTILNRLKSGLTMRQALYNGKATHKNK